MTRHLRFASICASVAALAVAPFACSASGNHTDFAAGGGGGGVGGGSTSSAGDVSSVGGFTAAGSGGGASCAVHCSPDLHQILDCNDAVVSTCPSDQGCAAGICIAPCDAAKANASTQGCDFYSVVPGPEYETRGSCFTVMLANTWTSPVSIQANYGGTPLNVGAMARTPVGSGQNISYQPLQNGQLAPGQIGLLFLSSYESGDVYHVGCPGGVTPGISMDPAVDKTGRGQAFHITTSAPVIAYDIYPYGGASSFVSSATLLVPTPAWGTNYIAVDAYEADPNLEFVNGDPFIQIVAAEDGTQVTMSPTAAIGGGPNVQGTGKGQPVTYSMSKGEVIQFLQTAELSGSPISSNKPISVWGGSSCANIPVGVGACDSAHQELLPVSALGYDYAAVRYRDRGVGFSESIPWTLVGTVDGTALTYDPAPPVGSPGSINSGQAVTFSASDAFSVRSNDDKHPFYLAAHMTGALSVFNNPNNDGDPEFVSTIPAAQWLRHYLFLTDPTYRNTHLVFVRQKVGGSAFKDVTLDCAGKLSGWAPIGASGIYEFTRVDLTKDGSAQGGCDNGVHTADSEAPFGLTVWGWDTTVSYAYPAGMSVKPVNTVVVPPTPK